MKQFNLIGTISAAAILLTAGAANAQLSDCSSFMQGNHVEVGVNWNGAYGTSKDAPAGYHPRGAATEWNICDSTESDTTGLGFVADPNFTGWSSYYGDYFLPGDPEEGWSIKADGMQRNQYNDMGTPANPAIDSMIIGSNISYTNTGSTITTTWQGVFDSIQITQVTTLDTGDLFFTVHMTLTNLGSLARENVYYLRTVDPDNDEPETGDFTTHNTIAQQLPDTSGYSIVTAAGIELPDAFLALGANDPRAKVFTMDYGLTPYVDLATIYSEGTTYQYTQGDTSDLDVGIGVVFNIGELPGVDSAADSTGRIAGNSATFTYAYGFKKGAVENGFNPTHALAVQNVSTNQPTIAAYPNPFNNSLNITGLNTTDHLVIFDMMGRSVNADLTIRNDGTNNFKLNMPAGHYLLQVIDKSGNVRSRIPVQKM